MTTWWYCSACQAYHTANCSSWFSRSQTNASVSTRTPIWTEEWKIELWSTGVSHLTERRRRT